MLLAAALVACGNSAPEIGRARLFAMGTWVTIAIADADPETFDAAIDATETLLAGFERDYYAWGDGELAALNATLADGRSFQASPELADLVATAKRLSVLSEGTFEPAVAPLVEAWGFNDAASAVPAEPDRSRLAAILSTLIPIGALEIDGREISSPEGPITLDLGGIAKGRAVDLITALLESFGIHDALIDAGGDVRVIGEPPGRHWRVGVQDPRADASIGTIELEDGEAAFTSGDYERYFDVAGARMHHLIDPATGYPAGHTEAVTVLAPEGTLADAAATAIFIAGPGRWRRVAAALGIRDVLRVDASGRIELTPTMRDRLQISAGKLEDIMPTSP